MFLFLSLVIKSQLANMSTLMLNVKRQTPVRRDELFPSVTAPISLLVKHFKCCKEHGIQDSGKSTRRRLPIKNKQMHRCSSTHKGFGTLILKNNNKYRILHFTYRNLTLPKISISYILMLLLYYISEANIAL